MTPVAEVRRLGHNGGLILRRAANGRAVLFHVRDNQQWSAICGFVPSGEWSEDYPRDGGGVCSHCRRHLQRAGFYVSMVGLIAEEGAPR
jgi:hypothetical protein